MVYNELPARIKELMKDNILEIEDFSKEMVIKVTNAY